MSIPQMRISFARLLAKAYWPGLTRTLRDLAYCSTIGALKKSAVEGLGMRRLFQEMHGFIEGADDRGLRLSRPRLMWSLPASLPAGRSGRRCRLCRAAATT